MDNIIGYFEPPPLPKYEVTAADYATFWRVASHMVTGRINKDDSKMVERCMRIAEIEYGHLRKASKQVANSES